jgi:hypothetical protein
MVHVDSADYQVAVYIEVGGWWNKPYWNRPLAPIQSDGRWQCDITTGGVDEQATRIVAFLVPKGFQPPLLSGSATLPAVLAETALARAEVSRP